MKIPILFSLGLVFTLGLFFVGCRPVYSTTSALGGPVYVVGPEDARGNVLVAEQSSLKWLSHGQNGPEVVSQIELAGVNDLAQDGNGNIWAATNSGLARIDPSSGDVALIEHPRLEGKRVFSVEISDSRIWFGVFGEGLGSAQMDRRLSDVSFYDAGVLTSTLVSDIVSVNRRLTWIATLGDGVLLLEDGRLEQEYAIGEGLPTSYVNDISYSPPTLWIATYSGLAELSNGAVLARGEPDVAKAEIMYSVTVVDGSTVLVGGAAGGPFAFCSRDASWRNANLTDDIIYDFYLTDEAIWIASFRGLLIVPRDLVSGLCE